MSAQMLREAAALMRERAEAAASGEWSVYEMPSLLGVTAPYNRRVVGVAAPNGKKPEMRANVAHVASWHPAVALAVANQLDAMAAVVEEVADSPLALVAASIAEKSLAVAAAYLGRTP